MNTIFVNEARISIRAVTYCCCGGEGAGQAIPLVELYDMVEQYRVLEIKFLNRNSPFVRPQSEQTLSLSE